MMPDAAFDTAESAPPADVEPSLTETAQQAQSLLETFASLTGPVGEQLAQAETVLGHAIALLAVRASDPSVIDRVTRIARRVAHSAGTSAP